MFGDADWLRAPSKLLQRWSGTPAYSICNVLRASLRVFDTIHREHAPRLCSRLPTLSSFLLPAAPLRVSYQHGNHPPEFVV